MAADLFGMLEERVGSLLLDLSDLKRENGELRREYERLSGEREGLKSRIDSILKSLEGV